MYYGVYALQSRSPLNRVSQISKRKLRGLVRGGKLVSNRTDDLLAISQELLTNMCPNKSIRSSNQNLQADSPIISRLFRFSMFGNMR